MNAQNHFCPICHGGRKQAGLTTFTVELGFGVEVVRNEPAQVYDLCGTDWLEDSVAEKLEQIVEQARQKHSVVEVANWPQENGLPSAYLNIVDQQPVVVISRAKIMTMITHPSHRPAL